MSSKSALTISFCSIYFLIYNSKNNLPEKWFFYLTLFYSWILVTPYCFLNSVLLAGKISKVLPKLSQTKCPTSFLTSLLRKLCILAQQVCGLFVSPLPVPLSAPHEASVSPASEPNSVHTAPGSWLPVRTASSPLEMPWQWFLDLSK